MEQYLTQKQKNMKLARELCSMAEELLEDFVRDNVDMDLDPDDMYDQYETCRQYIRDNVFRGQQSPQEPIQGELFPETASGTAASGRTA